MSWISFDARLTAVKDRVAGSKDLFLAHRAECSVSDPLNVRVGIALPELQKTGRHVFLRFALLINKARYSRGRG